jgi:hypothetical protein
MPGLAPNTSKYNYLWGNFFRFGLAESPFKQWWSKYLFCPWLFRGNKTPLEILQRTHRFIPNSTGYKLVSRQTGCRGIFTAPIWKTTIFDEVRQLSNTISIKLINGTYDTIIDVHNARYLSYISSIKLYELNGGHSLCSQPELYTYLVQIII